ncbi:MAG: hypothetical protein U0166_08110 [Acidobacteriota bacterium]
MQVDKPAGYGVVDELPRPASCASLAPGTIHEHLRPWVKWVPRAAGLCLDVELDIGRSLRDPAEIVRPIGIEGGRMLDGSSEGPLMAHLLVAVDDGADAVVITFRIACGSTSEDCRFSIPVGPPRSEAGFLPATPLTNDPS